MCSASFVSTDQGNYFGSSKRCPQPQALDFSVCYATTNLGLLHYAAASYEHYDRKATERATSGYHFGDRAACKGMG